MRLFTLLDKLTDIVTQGVYPVDSILITMDSRNPGTYIPNTTWVAFATGKTLIGVNIGDADFDEAGNTGGSKAAKLVTHTHTMKSGGEHAHRGYRTEFQESGSGTKHYSAAGTTEWNSTKKAGAHTHTINAPTGDNVVAADNKSNLPPYITVYMWRRTA